MKQAISIAKMQLSSQLEGTVILDDLPMKATFLSPQIDRLDTKVWIVSYFPSYPSSTVYAVTIESPSGIILNEGIGLSWDFKDVWEKWGREEYYFWPAEEKALFHEAYQLHPTRIMPEEDALPQEKALAIAFEAIENKFGVPRGAIEPTYKVDYNYVKNADHTYDMVDCMVDWSGALLWTQTLPLGVAMPWGDNRINDTGDGYLFSTEQHIWKRNGKGELVWQKEPQLPEAFNLQKYCRVEDVDVVIGSYYPKQDDIPASLPLLLFLDQDGNLIHHRKYSAQELDITGDYIESVSVTFKEVRSIKKGMAVAMKYYGIRRPQKYDFMLLDTEGEIVERYLLPINSEQDLVDMFVDSESRLRYVLSNLNQITIL